MNSDIKEHDEHATTHGLSSAESAKLERLVMCIDEQCFNGDPASPEDTIVRFVDGKGNTVCRMEFYADQECDALYVAALKYATRMGIEKKFTSNVNNHYYT